MLCGQFGDDDCKVQAHPGLLGAELYLHAKFPVDTLEANFGDFSMLNSIIITNVLLAIEL